MSKFIIWVMLFITSHAPPGRPNYIPENQETKEEAVARYESIARDLEEVLLTEPPLFRGPHGKARTATVLLSVMLFESGFHRNVDFGLGKYARGDNGRSWCLTQQHIGTGRTISWNKVHNRWARASDPPEQVELGWTGEELIADRKKCIRVALRGIRSSFNSCRTYPVNEWLRSYGSGTCEAGGEASIKRMALAITWYGQHKPEPDAVLFAPPAPPSLLPDEPLAPGSPIALGD